VGTVRSAASKPEQNTLILRDIPKSTPSEDIVALFTAAVTAEGTPCPAPQSVRADMNDTWYVLLLLCDCDSLFISYFYPDFRIVLG